MHCVLVRRGEATKETPGRGSQKCIDDSRIGASGAEMVHEDTQTITSCGSPQLLKRARQLDHVHKIPAALSERVLRASKHEYACDIKAEQLDMPRAYDGPHAAHRTRGEGSLHSQRKLLDDLTEVIVGIDVGQLKIMSLRTRAGVTASTRPGLYANRHPRWVTEVGF